MLYIWIGIIVVSGIVEIATVNLVSVWFVVGGLVAIIANAFNASSIVQVILFIVVSLLCIVITRPLAKKYLRTEIVNTNSDRIIGKHGLVTKHIDADNKGEVKVMSTFWLASSVDNSTLNEGDYCEILAIEGVHVVVKKIEK
jgi:membrane protein implicated in regulation of membrane protease activity